VQAASKGRALCGRWIAAFSVDFGDPPKCFFFFEVVRDHLDSSNVPFLVTKDTGGQFHGPPRALAPCFFFLGGVDIAISWQ